MYGPGVTPLGIVTLAEMVDPSPEIFVIVAVIPAGAVIPVAVRKFRPVIVTGTVVLWVPLVGDTLVNTGVTVMFEDAPSAMPVELA